MHMLRTSVPASLMVVLILAMAVPGDASVTMPTGDALYKALRFRQTFGLETKHPYIQSSWADSYSFPDLEWGVPLSIAEADALTAKQVTSAELQGALEWATSQVNYAGAYVDQLHDGLVVFLVTGDSARFAGNVAERLPGGVELAVRVVERSLAELTAVKDSVSNQRDSLWKSGVKVMSAGVDVPTNTVEVGLLEETDAAVRRIHTIDSDIVVFQRPPSVLDCSMTSCSAPMKGGLDIWTPWNSSYQGSDSPIACTSGYIARRVDGSHSDVGFVTAGHCVGYKQDKHSDSWKFGTEGTVGTQVDDHGWFNNSECDVAFVKLNSSWNSGDLNNFLGRPDASPPDVKQFTSTTHWSYQIPGLAVCRNGYGSWRAGQGRACGTITEFDTDSTATTRDNETCEGTDCRYIHQTKAVSFDSTAGDSGGPVYQKEYGSNDVDLFGTHNDSVPDGNNGIGPQHDEFGWYTTVSQAQSAFYYQLGGMVIVPCLDANC